MPSLTSAASKKTVLLTEASSGIGYELSRLFAQDGYNLVLISIDSNNLKIVAGELEEKYKTFVKPLVKDLSKIGAAKEIYNELKGEQIKIDTLVNNAASSVYGNFTDIELQDQLKMLQVNIVSLTELTQLIAKDMIINSGGKILNVASTAAFHPGPLMAVYYASKAYVLHLSEALSNEFKNRNITVTTLCPPLNGKNMEAGNSSNIRIKKILDSESIAKEGYDGLKKGKTIVIPGMQNKLLTLGFRLFPRNLITNYTRMLQEKSKR